MKRPVLVQVDHRRLSTFLPAEKSRGRLPLTTLQNNQKRAIIELYIAPGRKPKRIGEIIVDNLPPAGAGELLMELHGKLDGMQLSTSLQVNGNPWTRKTFDLRPAFRGRKTLFTLLSAGIVAVVLFLLFAFTPLLGTDTFGIKKADIFDKDRQTTRQTEKPEPVKEEESSYKETTVQPDAAESDETGKPDESSRQKVQKETSDPAAEPQETKTSQEAEESTEPKEPLPPPIETRLYFLPDTAQLRADSLDEIRSLAKRLNEEPENRRYIIAGHCALFGTEKGRTQLSKDRAERVYQLLLDAGWEPSTPPEIIGYGGDQPVTHDREMQSLNRRVEIKPVDETLADG
ncbi:MAG: OmpA family protein [Spirochaetales bacterium]|nr:OmpA family protein [Spirochaetales bacterium]MCF7938728.1 OmpA family protein [Spirochaetales bacterium]